MLHEARLKARGWSAGEIAHAKRILQAAEQRKRPLHRLLEHIGHGLTLLTISIIALGIILWLSPIILLASLPISLPILLLMGACVGLLLVTSLHHLHLERRHQHISAAITIGVTGALVGGVLTRIIDTYATMGRAPASPALFAAVLVAGILIPCIVHWTVTDAA